jgi:hypothetical protein
MNRKEAAEMLISKRSGVYKRYELRHDRFYDALVKDGFSVEDDHMYLLTDATPLALLSPACLKRAEKLASEPQLLCLTRVENRRHYDALVGAGLAVSLNGCAPRWEPTKLLRAAVKCWREAKEGNQ